MKLDPYPVMNGRKLDDSEWRKVIALLDEVNRPKAATLKAIYKEHVENAWQNYQKVYTTIMNRIDRHNEWLQERYFEYERMMQDYMNLLQEREQFWEDQIKEPRDRYMSLSVIAESIPGAWTEDLARSINGPKAYTEYILSYEPDEEQENAPPSQAEGSAPTGQSPAPQPQTPGASPALDPSGAGAKSQPKGAAATEKQASPPGRRPIFPFTFPFSSTQQAPAQRKGIPVLSREEVADEGQITTFADNPIHIVGRFAVTVVMGFLAAFAFLRATNIAEIDRTSLAVATAIASIILYGIWEATRSASAIASEAFHMRWRETFKRKLLTLVLGPSLLVTALVVMQLGWTWYMTANVNPELNITHEAIAARLLWLIWPWYLALAALDGLLRGRREAVNNRIEAEIVRAERAEELLSQRGGRTTERADKESVQDKTEEPEDEETDKASSDIVEEYRKARATYETLRRQRDLDLAFIGRRIKQLESSLRFTHYIPNDADQRRIANALKQYEKIVVWFLDQVADALRDVGGGISAGEILRKLAHSLGVQVSDQLRLETDQATNGQQATNQYNTFPKGGTIS